MSAQSEFRVKNFEFRIMKYILIVFSFLILHSVLLIQPAHAQTPNQLSAISYQSSENQLSPLPPTVSPTSPLYTDLLVNNLFHSFSCLAIGQSVIGQPCLTYQITKNAQGTIQSVPMLSQVNLSGGTLVAVTSVIGALYDNPPVKTADYLASVGRDFGFVKEANAQVIGSGANILNPIFTLWQVSRNISYVIMIIVFVIIGLMVMFRNRINPQTVITAQAALPGLVIGLLLITFSYFLAGLISDTAFIGTNIVGYYFAAAQNKPASNLVQKMSGNNVTDIVSGLLKGVKKDDIAGGVASFFSSIGEPDLNTSNPATLVRSFAAVAAYQIGSQIGPAIGASMAALGCGAATIWTGVGALLAIPTCAGIGQAIGGIGGGLYMAQQTWSNPAGMVGYALWVVAIVIIIYSMLKLLLRLINNFLTIIFLTITAPFQFLLAALPGRQGLATSWILNMLANVLAFPAVIAVFYFVAIILGQSAGPLTVSSLPQSENSAGVPVVYAQEKTNITSTATFPLLGGLNLGFINVLLAFGALVATPAIPDIIGRAIGRMGQAGQLIGQELSGSTRAGRGYLNQAQGGLTGVSRDVGGLGGLANQPGGQFMPDGRGGWTWVETKMPGKITLARRRLGF